MRIAVGSDHAGFVYKNRIVGGLRDGGHEVEDFGTHSQEPCDYPMVVRPVAEAVAGGNFERGIVLGGSGNGEAMVANRVRGVRCAVCWNAESAVLGRRHNDANILSIGERMMEWDVAWEIVSTFLAEPFDGGRHARRLALLDAPKET